MSIGNIPGLFSIIQGAKAQPRFPQTHQMPDGNAMAGPSMGGPNTPGYLFGGEMAVGGYMGDEPTLEERFAADGDDDGDPEPDADYAVIARMGGDGGYEAGVKTWVFMTPAQKATERATFDAENAAALRDLAPDSDGGSAATYAGIAQRAAEARMQDAREREFERNRMTEQKRAAAVEREKAGQDFFNNRELLKTQRAQLQADRTTGALNAWSQNVGHANIPGIENYSLQGGQGAEAAVQAARPKLNFNPLAAYAQSPEWEEGTAPNIPGLDYS